MYMHFDRWVQVAVLALAAVSSAPGMAREVASTQTDTVFSFNVNGDREVTITRVFEAPRERIFDIMTNFDTLGSLYPAENGSAGFTAEGESDTVGGEWRLVDATGKVAMRGVIREFVRPERVVTTEWTMGAPPYPTEVLATLVFTEHERKTRFVATVQFESRMARDIAIKSDLEGIEREAYNRVDNLLASAPATAGVRREGTGTTTDGNRRVVKEFLQAMMGADEPEMRKRLSADATWTVWGTLPVSGVHRGREAIFRDVFGLNDRFDLDAPSSLDITKLIAEESSVATEFHLVAMAKNGKRYDMHYALVFDLRDGLIVAVREYVDTMHMKEVVFD